MPVPLINIFLFLATVFTTVMAGTLLEGINPFDEPGKIYRGLPFSFTLLTILGIHELAHYIVSRKRGVECSLPYFIPIPPPISLLGTLGAFIRMKSGLRDRTILIEIGLAGPLAGFCVALVAVFIGLSQSQVREASPELVEGLRFGSSLLFSFLTWAVLGVSADSDAVILLNPIAFAGWIGFFITALNLLPAGQLDGGHIIYALMGRKSRFIPKVVFFILLGLGFLWQGWFIWAALVLALGFRHPALWDEHSPLLLRHKVLVIVAGLILVGTFVPIPIRI